MYTFGIKSKLLVIPTLRWVMQACQGLWALGLAPIEAAVEAGLTRSWGVHVPMLGCDFFLVDWIQFKPINGTINSFQINIPQKAGAPAKP